MAQAKLHALLESLRGSVGDIVLKRYGDRVIVSKKPDMSRRKLSEKQRAHHERFRRGAAYGRMVRDTPELAAVYAPVAEERGQAVYHVALRDAMHEPVIEEVDLSAFSAQSGGTIAVRATDDFEVVRVEVDLVDESGDVVSKLEADRQGDEWLCTAEPTAGTLTAVRVRAFDRPGNRTELRVPADA